MDLTEEDIDLARGNAGLGFNIKGGIDIPHVPGDYGIFVTKIRDDGAAYSDGRLKEGDKILYINGKCLEQVTHQEAVALFMNAGETVKLKVKHGAEEQIKMQQRTEKESRNSLNNTVLRKDQNDDDSDGNEHYSIKSLFTLGILTSVAVVFGYVYYRKYRS